MKFLSRSTYTLTLVAFMLSVSQRDFHLIAQTMEKKNINWVSPDKSFSIITPVKLKKLKAPYKDESRSGFNSMEFYAGRQAENAYVVYVFEWTEKRNLLSFEDRINGIEFILGGDDDKEFKSTFREINGLKTKEIIFSDQNVRGLIVDGNGKAYVLGLSADNREVLHSEAANRFFGSLKLLR